ERARGDHQRTREVDLPRARTAGEVAVDRRHGDLVRRERDAGAGLDARAAARVDQLDAGRLEQLHVAHLLGVVADALPPELDLQLDAGRQRAALLQRLAHHARVHVDVRLLAAGARASVGDVHLHLAL